MARSVEPTLVAIWEAMAAESGRAGQAGRAEMLDNFEHAVGLGGGLESWMGYSAGEHGHTGRTLDSNLCHLVIAASCYCCE